MAEAEWPGILSPAETEQLRGLLLDPARRSTHVVRRYLLTGLLRCGLCGAALVARPRDGGDRRYACPKGANFDGCGGIYALADPLEAFIVDAVLYRLHSPELAAQLNGGAVDLEAEPWQLEADQAASQLEELAAMFGRREISMAEWLAARTPVEQRAAVAKKRLRAFRRNYAVADHAGNGEALRTRWADLGLGSQRAIVEGACAFFCVCVVCLGLVGDAVSEVNT